MAGKDKPSDDNRSAPTEEIIKQGVFNNEQLERIRQLYLPQSFKNRTVHPEDKFEVVPLNRTPSPLELKLQKDGFKRAAEVQRGPDGVTIPAELLGREIVVVDQADLMFYAGRPIFKPNHTYIVFARSEQVAGQITHADLYNHHTQTYEIKINSNFKHN